MFIVRLMNSLNPRTLSLTIKDKKVNNIFGCENIYCLINIKVKNVCISCLYHQHGLTIEAQSANGCFTSLSLNTFQSVGKLCRLEMMFANFGRRLIQQSCIGCYIEARSDGVGILTLLSPEHLDIYDERSVSLPTYGKTQKISGSRTSVETYSLWVWVLLFQH